MSHEILEHTADAKFRATGETLEEAFEETVRAFAQLVGDGEKGSVRHSFQIESESHEALLFDFLDQLIFLQDTEGVIICDVKNIKITDYESGHKLEATVLVDNIDPAGSYLDIKGPTYSEMEVGYSQDEHAWEIIAVLDI